jgi:hypothetical protein
MAKPIETKKVDTEAVESADVTNNPEQAQVEPVQLQISDLQALGQIINLASKRGAFEASEMEFVGNKFNRLNAFLGYVASQQTEEEASESSKEDTKPTPDVNAE